jgi:hypothetical protein
MRKKSAKGETGENDLHLFSIGQLSYFQKYPCCLRNAISIFGYQFKQCVVLFVGIQKHVITKRQHWFVDFFPYSFSLDIISTNRLKLPMHAKRHVLLSSTNSPLITLMTNSVM